MYNMKRDSYVTVLFRSLSLVTILPRLGAGVSIGNEGTVGASSFADLLVLASVTAFIFLSVVIIFLCGGCTDMEVSTDTHPACGSSRTRGDKGSIEMGGKTFITEICDINGQQTTLPYSLSPQVFNTANTFVGYESNIPSTQALLPGINVRPNAHIVQDYQATWIGPGVYHPAGESEIPPPSYNEAVRTSRSYQHYGF